MSNPYVKSVRHLDEIDIYQIGNLYDVKSHAVFHALKKLLCAGKRGAKDYEQDLMEAIESIERELQMQETAFPSEPEWDAYPTAKYAWRSPNGYFIYAEAVRPGITEFHCRPVVESFDEQRIDVIGQNGNEGEHYEWVDYTFGDSLPSESTPVYFRRRNGNFSTMPLMVGEIRWGSLNEKDQIVSYRLA